MDMVAETGTATLIGLIALLGGAAESATAVRVMTETAKSTVNSVTDDPALAQKAAVGRRGTQGVLLGTGQVESPWAHLLVVAT